MRDALRFDGFEHGARLERVEHHGRLPVLDVAEDLAHVTDVRERSAARQHALAPAHAHVGARARHRFEAAQREQRSLGLAGRAARVDDGDGIVGGDLELEQARAGCRARLLKQPLEGLRRAWHRGRR